MSRLRASGVILSLPWFLALLLALGGERIALALPANTFKKDNPPPTPTSSPASSANAQVRAAPTNLPNAPKSRSFMGDLGSLSEAELRAREVLRIGAGSMAGYKLYQNLNGRMRPWTGNDGLKAAAGDLNKLEPRPIGLDDLEAAKKSRELQTRKLREVKLEIEAHTRRLKNPNLTELERQRIKSDLRRSNDLAEDLSVRVKLDDDIVKLRSGAAQLSVPRSSAYYQLSGQRTLKEMQEARVSGKDGYVTRYEREFEQLQREKESLTSGDFNDRKAVLESEREAAGKMHREMLEAESTFEQETAKLRNAAEVDAQAAHADYLKNKAQLEERYELRKKKIENSFSNKFSDAEKAHVDFEARKRVEEGFYADSHRDAMRKLDADYQKKLDEISQNHRREWMKERTVLDSATGRAADEPLLREVQKADERLKKIQVQQSSVAVAAAADAEGGGGANWTSRLEHAEADFKAKNLELERQKKLRAQARIENYLADPSLPPELRKDLSLQRDQLRRDVRRMDEDISAAKRQAEGLDNEIQLEEKRAKLQGHGANAGEVARLRGEIAEAERKKTAFDAQTQHIDDVNRKYVGEKVTLDAKHNLQSLVEEKQFLEDLPSNDPRKIRLKQVDARIAAYQQELASLQQARAAELGELASQAPFRVVENQARVAAVLEEAGKKQEAARVLLDEKIANAQKHSEAVRDLRKKVNADPTNLQLQGELKGAEVDLGLAMAEQETARARLDLANLEHDKFEMMGQDLSDSDLKLRNQEIGQKKADLENALAREKAVKTQHATAAAAEAEEKVKALKRQVEEAEAALQQGQNQAAAHAAERAKLEEKRKKLDQKGEGFEAKKNAKAEDPLKIRQDVDQLKLEQQKLELEHREKKLRLQEEKLELQRKLTVEQGESNALRGKLVELDEGEVAKRQKRAELRQQYQDKRSDLKAKREDIDARERDARRKSYEFQRENRANKQARNKAFEQQVRQAEADNVLKTAEYESQLGEFQREAEKTQAHADELRDKLRQLEEGKKRVSAAPQHGSGSAVGSSTLGRQIELEEAKLTLQRQHDGLGRGISWSKEAVQERFRGNPKLLDFLRDNDYPELRRPGFPGFAEAEKLWAANPKSKGFPLSEMVKLAEERGGNLDRPPTLSIQDTTNRSGATKIKLGQLKAQEKAAQAPGSLGAQTAPGSLDAQIAQTRAELEKAQEEARQAKGREPNKPQLEDIEAMRRKQAAAQSLDTPAGLSAEEKAAFEQERKNLKQEKQKLDDDHRRVMNENSLDNRAAGKRAELEAELSASDKKAGATGRRLDEIERDGRKLDDEFEVKNRKLQQRVEAAEKKAKTLENAQKRRARIDAQLTDLDSKKPNLAPLEQDLTHKQALHAAAETDLADANKKLGATGPDEAVKLTDDPLRGPEAGFADEGDASKGFELDDIEGKNADNVDDAAKKVKEKPKEHERDWMSCFMGGMYTMQVAQRSISMKEIAHAKENAKNQILELLSSKGIFEIEASPSPSVTPTESPVPDKTSPPVDNTPPPVTAAAPPPKNSGIRLDINPVVDTYDQAANDLSQTVSSCGAGGDCNVFGGIGTGASGANAKWTYASTVMAGGPKELLNTLPIPPEEFLKKVGTQGVASALASVIPMTPQTQGPMMDFLKATERDADKLGPYLYGGYLQAKGATGDSGGAGSSGRAGAGTAQLSGSSEVANLPGAAGGSPKPSASPVKSTLSPSQTAAFAQFRQGSNGPARLGAVQPVIETGPDIYHKNTDLNLFQIVSEATARAAVRLR